MMDVRNAESVLRSLVNLLIVYSRALKYAFHPLYASLLYGHLTNFFHGNQYKLADVFVLDLI